MMSKSKAAWLFGLAAFYCLIAMHIYWPNRGGSGFYLPWNLVGGIFIALLIIGAMLFSRPPLATSGFFNLLASGSLILLLPLLWAQQPWLSEALPRLMGLVLGVLAYFALLQIPLDRRWRRRLLMLLLAATVIEALLGLVQYSLLQPGNWMGYNTLKNRPYGIFQQWNLMASFMATGLALALYLLSARRPLSRSLQWLAAAMLLLAPLLLIVIASRVGLLAALLLSPLQLWMLYRLNRRRAGIALLLLMAGVSAGLLLVMLNGATRALMLPEPIFYRLTYWQEALDMIAERPWLGWGYGHFQYDFLHHFYTTHSSGMESVAISHPHNEILLWGVEGGLLSLSGIALIVWGLWRLLRHSRPVPLRPAPWLAALPILLHMMVEYPLYLSAAHAVLLLVILRVSDLRRRLRLPSHSQLPLRLTTAGIAALMVPYLLNGLHSALIITAVEKSGLRQFGPMSQVITPTPWQVRYDYDMQLRQLLQYPQTRDMATLLSYQQWAENEIRVRPDANIYINLMAVSRLLQQPQRAADLQRQAKRLFPHDARFEE
ncbi:TPA: O-antigen ligase C-terminal domain-containing protein [Serratia liquefaciens]|mgnify:CR=1 FL=1|jgi:O-antigen polymerase|uniref:O-antigen ligase C-terminal domain-containing protein n=2 Tax=Serratia liquefaciens TaxID=614 RepID=A0ABX7D7F2_SERLI|nr:O-antigen ligase family protein [Serratia liquefaciens]QQU55508.1 O-antigen ligase C-terminal domain-containing protein [Serratia liquefaciens]RYM69772.1 polymerase [Serratia liquefaciens]RYM76204.1 polymerase [Serratia liquefaciens]HED2338166.1 O-antigen ligase C-terminal domain-containing protein [Serratia liquefaciens]HEJ7945025.1 O-antigen ligase C-terminal domain-containing protein [Serratia liquefaciens]